MLYFVSLIERFIGREHLVKLISEHSLKAASTDSSIGQPLSDAGVVIVLEHTLVQLASLPDVVSNKLGARHDRWGRLPDLVYCISMFCIWNEISFFLCVWSTTINIPLISSPRHCVVLELCFLLKNWPMNPLRFWHVCNSFWHYTPLNPILKLAPFDFFIVIVCLLPDGCVLFTASWNRLSFLFCCSDFFFPEKFFAAVGRAVLKALRLVHDQLAGTGVLWRFGLWLYKDMQILIIMLVVLWRAHEVAA